MDSWTEGSGYHRLIEEEREIVVPVDLPLGPLKPPTLIHFTYVHISPGPACTALSPAFESCPMNCDSNFG